MNIKIQENQFETQSFNQDENKSHYLRFKGLLRFNNSWTKPESFSSSTNRIDKYN